MRPPFLLVCLGALTACAFNTRGTVEESYDEFRQTTNLVAQFDQLPFHVTMVALPDRAGGAELGSLTISSTNDDWRYLRCRSVDALADGTPVPLPAFEHSGDVDRVLRSVVVRERLTAQLPLATFATFADAGSVRVRVCNDVFEWTPDQIGAVRSFVQRWRARAGVAGTRQAGPAATARMLPCGIPAGHVRVCLSSRGYRFALPYAEPCPSGSSPAGAAELTCAALERPAYHACLAETGGWQAVHSWVSCSERGLLNAAGDFVPPGRSPEQGVGPEPGPRDP